MGQACEKARYASVHNPVNNPCVSRSRAVNTRPAGLRFLAERRARTWPPLPTQAAGMSRISKPKFARLIATVLSHCRRLGCKCCCECVHVRDSQIGEDVI